MGWKSEAYSTTFEVLPAWRNALSFSALRFSQRREPRLRRLADRFRIPQRRVGPFLDLGHHAADAVLEGDRRGPTELARDLVDVGPGDVGLAGALRKVDDRAAD